MSDIVDIIEQGLKDAKRIMKAWNDLDALMRREATLPKSTVAQHPENRPSPNVNDCFPDIMKNVTPKKRIPEALDVDFHVTESPHPSRNKKSKPSNPK